MQQLFSNQYIILAMTFAVFYYFRRLQYRTGWVLLNPILIAIVLLIAYLKITGVSFETFEQSGQLIDFWLKPAVVALGVPLYLQFEAIKKLWFPIVLSQLVGCLVGIVSVVVVAQLFGVDLADDELGVEGEPFAFGNQSSVFCDNGIAAVHNVLRALAPSASTVHVAADSACTLLYE